MWLKYGLNADNGLISIEEAPRGKTGLRCPYCGGELTAKKGKIKVHHFAHTGTPCQPVLRRTIPTLPLYDNFFVRLSAPELYQLGQLWQQYGVENRPIPHVPFRFVLSKLLIRQGEGYEFAPLGKIPLGVLPLREFNQVQELLLASELRKLTGRAERAQLLGLSNVKECLAAERTVSRSTAAHPRVRTFHETSLLPAHSGRWDNPTQNWSDAAGHGGTPARNRTGLAIAFLATFH